MIRWRPGGGVVDVDGDPGDPDLRGGARYLTWLVTRQAGRSAAGAVYSVVWMGLFAVAPYLLERVFDDGFGADHPGRGPGDPTASAVWTAALLATALAGAGVSLLRHRTMTKVRMDANFRTVKLLLGQSVRLGPALTRRVSAGEVMTIGVGDVQTIAAALTVVGPGFGAVVTYLLVAALLFSVSPLPAVVALLGVPALALALGPLTSRLQAAETVYRERQNTLTARIGDLAGGLRVLNGLGGKALFADAFRRDSALLREQGYRVGAVTSWMQSLGLGLPTVLLAAVIWSAARPAALGEITPGQLVSVYGYVIALVYPVFFLVEGVQLLSRGLVAARRVVAFLRLEPDPGPAPAEAMDAPDGPAELHDPVSGVTVRPGVLTALVCADPEDGTAVLDRLARYGPTSATWGGVPLDRIATARVRERILLAEAEADLFAGSLRVLLGRGPGDGSDEARARALRTAAAEDVVRGLPDGLDSAVDAQGRNLSGGQRQRIRLARALLAGPEVLLLAEPTSALDAHTEDLVAGRLRAARAGLTTVVTSTSPLMLDRADVVHLLEGGRAVATGRHQDLLVGEPRYRALVARESGAAAGPEDVPTSEEPVR
ncbi:ABC transporter transmembrane domain-containing protein [Streptomyces fragilis]|uniref:ABC transporter ATP-binding protein n=1 Tax=Streptomyces fragilis TaxID=67301 RepID=A0ABV2YKB9_9ACTN|nr:ABC transporter ATP-binding protein [Streptomyces fragilis]